MAALDLLNEYLQIHIVAALKVRTVTNDTEITFNNLCLPINTTQLLGCYVEILSSLHSQMKAFHSHHSRMLFIRVDIRQNFYSGDNGVISDFMRKLKKHLMRKYKTKTIGYLWAREIDKSEFQHYHLIIMLDGKKVKYPANVLKKIEEIANKWGWPKPYTPKSYYYLIHKQDRIKFNEAFLRGSYLAKVRSKGKKNLTANNYGSSMIKPKEELC